MTDAWAGRETAAQLEYLPVCVVSTSGGQARPLTVHGPGKKQARDDFTPGPSLNSLSQSYLSQPVQASFFFPPFFPPLPFAFSDPAFPPARFGILAF